MNRGKLLRGIASYCEAQIQHLTVMPKWGPRLNRHFLVPNPISALPDAPVQMPPPPGPRKTTGFDPGYLSSAFIQIAFGLRYRTFNTSFLKSSNTTKELRSFLSILK